jgi:hypothetical protein
MDLNELAKLFGIEDKTVIDAATAKLAEQKVNVLFDNASENNYIPRARLNETNDKLNNYKTQTDDLQKQLETLSKSNKDNESLQTEIANMKEALLNSEKRNTDISINSAIREQAVKMKAKNTDLILQIFDKTGLVINDKGKVDGLKERFADIAKTNPFLFNEDRIVGTTPNGVPPVVNGGIDSKQFANMSYKDRVAMKQNQPEAFNTLNDAQPTFGK